MAINYCVRRTSEAKKILSEVARFKPGSISVRGTSLYAIDTEDVKRLRRAGYKLANKKTYSKNVCVYDIAALPLAKRSEVRTRYVELCNKRIQASYAEKKKELKEYIPLLEQSQHEVVELTRKIEILNRELGNAEDAAKAGKKRMEDEFDRMSSLPKVEKITATGERIEVHTTTIYCRNPGTRKFHELGKFRIVIDCVGHKILFFNKTGRKNGHHAPHVSEGGGACSGASFSKMVPELFGKYEYAAVVLLGIQFLESVNMNDEWGKFIKNWPVAKKVPKNASHFA